MYEVRGKRWSDGWELHIPDVGVTQCGNDLDEAEQTVRDYLATVGVGDAQDAEIQIFLSWDDVCEFVLPEA